MTVDPPDGGGWHPWIVARASGFEVQDERGRVGLVQIDRKQFLVSKPFRFVDQAVVDDLVARLVRGGMTDAEAMTAVDDARRFTPTTENPTDLASIPKFMRWFENPYGTHTLAAILHDNLIRDVPNTGALRSDTLADRFFREMMRTAGTRRLKRWIMWSAVALRTRWAAGGLRQVSVACWALTAVGGIGAFVWGVGDLLLGWDAPGGTAATFALAGALPFLAGVFWGRQYGASLVAAVAALWVLPAVLFVGLGYAVYMALEALAEGLARLSTRLRY